ncbi:MAG: type 4a pilus biogenesis protein PilO [Clostridium sp.]|uniref:type 4a pilus biogenesis protein PilO n=1 Tax=Clostridium sp. TaxID=1506 RepID=UPI00302B02E8
MKPIARSGRAMSSSEKTLIAILACVSALFLYWIFLMKPALDKVGPVSTRVEDLQKRVDAIGSIQSNITQKEETLKNLKVQYDEATKVIPRGDRYPELVKEIREMSEATTVAISSYSLSKPTAYSETGEATTGAGSSLNNYTIGLSVKGDYNNILAFVRKLEEDKRIVDVKSISSSKETATITLSYFVSGTIDQEDYDFNSGDYGKENPFN